MDELLLRPRDEACRLVALQYLDEAIEARGRLGQDVEALHDLRVALRRLRSTLRAWREVIDRPLRKREKGQLKQIVAATGEARDAEVLIELLKEEEAGEGFLPSKLAQRKQAGYAHVEVELAHLPALERRLRRRLARVSLDLLHPNKMAHALAEQLEQHTDDVEDDLFELHRAEQIEEAHAARISLKRLRYLIEPFKDDSPIARVVKACKALQDRLGDLHDAHIAMGEVAAALGDATLPPEEAPSLLAVGARLEARQNRLFAGVDGTELVAFARALAVDLRQR
jgi:CHAD domain-containing protein